MLVGCCFSCVYV